MSTQTIPLQRDHPESREVQTAEHAINPVLDLLQLLAFAAQGFALYILGVLDLALQNLVQILLLVDLFAQLLLTQLQSQFAALDGLYLTLFGLLALGQLGYFVF